MDVVRLKVLVARVEAAVEFDLGTPCRHYGRGPDGRLVLLVWWGRFGRQLSVRLYRGCTTVTASADLRGGAVLVGDEFVIGPGRDFVGVLRRGVDWLRSEASPRKFDPVGKAGKIVPDFDEEP